MPSCYVFFTLTVHGFAQNEMETACMKKIDQFSAGIHFQRFTGHIILNEDIVQFDNSIININRIEPGLIRIFELGLVFPALIYEASSTGEKYESKINFTTDTLYISDLSELHFANQSFDTKSFSFLLWHKDRLNPSLYLFKLTNENVHSKTSTETFIDGAKMTAFGFCSILI
jgi:hypothetical protein